MKNEIKSSRKPTCGGAHSPSLFLSGGNYYYFFARASEKRMVIMTGWTEDGPYYIISFENFPKHPARPSAIAKLQSTNTHQPARIRIYNISNVVKTYTAAARLASGGKAFLKYPFSTAIYTYTAPPAAAKQ